MHNTSFYRGVLHELQKTAQIVPRKKKPSIGQRMLLPGAAGMMVGAGILGLNALRKSKPATPEPTPTPSPTPTPAPAPAKDISQNIFAPKVNELTEANFLGDGSAQPVSPTITEELASPALNTAHAVGMTGMLGVPSLIMGADKMVGSGRLASMGGKSLISEGGKAQKLLNNWRGFYDKQLLPSLSNPNNTLNSKVKLSPGAAGGFGVTPFRLMNAIPSALDVQKDNSSEYWLNHMGVDAAKSPYADAAMKTGLSGAMLASTALPGSSLAHLTAMANKALLDKGNSTQLTRANSTANLGDILHGLEVYMKKGNPTESAQAREMVQHILTDPQAKKYIDSVVNPGTLQRMQMSNFGMTDGAPVSDKRIFSNPESTSTGEGFWSGERLQNTMPLQSKLNRMRRILGLPEEKMVDL